MKKIIQSVVLLGACLLAGFSANLHAEDIDIYMDNSSGGDLPNVLFVIDNSSNLGSTWGGGGCSGYADKTGAPSLGTNTAGGVIQCSLVDTINSLPDDRLKVGIMTGNASGFGTSRQCVGKDGGCLVYPLTTVNTANRPALIAFIKSWKSNNSAETPTSFPFTVNNAASGGMMQEAWAYYNGKTGLSGRTYDVDQLHACQKNFIIYLGNTDKTPNNEDLSGPTALTAAGATTDNKLATKITDPAVFNPPICGLRADQNGNLVVPAGTSANDWSSNWADEWARLLQSKDGGTADMEGMQNVITYAVGIINNASNQCTTSYPALLQSMANAGDGEAYWVSDAGQVKRAIAEVLNEVQAVNSVFSSASLPVSVNAEGSYLNQIFLGMFRPDTSGAPRWMGNLKQYQLFRSNAGQLVMGDATPCDSGTGYCPKPAISSGGTGFLSPNALSFWTYRDTSTVPDSIGGFFVNDMKGTPPSGFDYPPTGADNVRHGDGEVVEKGGVAQQLRKQNVSATFDGASGTTVNPRRVYTYCPDGITASCSNDLTYVDNDFSTSNSKIAAISFGSSLTVPVQSIVRSGSTVTVTTAGNHGFSTGSIVTIRNASQPEYNRTQTVTVLNATQFTMTGIPDYPVSPSTASYLVTVPGATGSYAISAVSRNTSTTTGSANETVTVTAPGHTYVQGQVVSISGVTPTDFNGSRTITGVSGNTFTFSIPIYPTSPAVNTYQVVASPRSVAINSITLAGGVYTVTTAASHQFHAGQTVTISGVTGKYKSDYNKDQRVTGVPTATTFTIAAPSTAPGNAGTGTVTPSTTSQQAASVTRNGTTLSTTATITGMPASWFATGDQVDISTTGTAAGESAAGGPGSYVASSVKITCLTTDCSSFSYPITVTPAESGTAFGSVNLAGAAGSAVIAAGNITRSGATATVTGVTPGVFQDGSTVSIAASSGSAPLSESAYVSNWKITCSDSTCAKFTFGPVTLTPASPATGTNIQAYSGNTYPDKNVMIRWLRGQDNHGDEKGPGNGVTVRESVHGDVLHSRPLVINYGDSRGIVVFYGSNDGVYRAVNGNQTNAINGSVNSGGTATPVSIPPGGELWGLILPEHYQLINRYRANSPELKFPGTFLDTALPKDYFVDGPTGVYQRLNADGTIAQAIIYLTMRRGGRFMYALDVTQPLSPRRLWSISAQTPGFEELGQTWSRPRLTLLQNYTTAADPTTGVKTHIPVLVFGAGYDPAQDRIGAGDDPTLPPVMPDSMGRGIFVVDAVAGTKVFSASVSCPASTDNCRTVDRMRYATPSDIAFVDRDLDGFTDKFYWGDLGGNVWRADVGSASVKDWAVNRVAQLGCDTGECASGVTPRKFFFPPAVLSVRPSSDPASYDALSLVSGDREHPLRNNTTSSAYNVNDRFFMIKDMGTSLTSLALNTKDVTASTTDLFNATYTAYDGTKKGFYIAFIGAAWNPDTNQPDPTMTPTKGEKAVNAPIAVNGQIFFATNQPKNKSNICVANLGTARAYAVSPFSGKQAQNELAGGGLPPSAVSGLISVTSTDASGNTQTTQEKFCIGCGISGTQAGGTNAAPCTSALENCNVGTVIPKNLKRTYWYKK